jgi:hypothetical protein
MDGATAAGGRSCCLSSDTPIVDGVSKIYAAQLADPHIFLD